MITGPRGVRKCLKNEQDILDAFTLWFGAKNFGGVLFFLHTCGSLGGHDLLFSRYSPTVLSDP